jgi:hypothetical protein
MSVRNLKKKSETDWARVDRMTDDEIDTSDIPPLDDAFFERAIAVLPRARVDRIDLIRARRLAAHVLAELLAKRWSNRKENLAHDAFNIALIVSYAKPFSSNRDLEGQREESLDRRVAITEILNEEEVDLHKRVKELRNSHYAHSDAASILVKGFDYSREWSLMKKELNLTRDEVESLKKIIDKWIKYLDNQISVTRDSAFLIAPDAGS